MIANAALYGQSPGKSRRVAHSPLIEIRRADLLRRMLARGVSRYHPDPLAAIAGREIQKKNPPVPVRYSRNSSKADN